MLRTHVKASAAHMYDPGGPIVKVEAEIRECQEARKPASLERTVEKGRNSSQTRLKARA